jgi:hypothetical protein
VQAHVLERLGLSRWRQRDGAHRLLLLQEEERGGASRVLTADVRGQWVVVVLPADDDPGVHVGAAHGLRQQLLDAGLSDARPRGLGRGLGGEHGERGEQQRRGEQRTTHRDALFLQWTSVLAFTGAFFAIPFR